MAVFEVYKDKSSSWRWRLKADNGKVIADCGEGYSSKSACKDGLAVVKKEAYSAEVKELE